MISKINLRALEWPFYGRQKEIMTDRSACKKSDFVDYFIDIGIDEIVASAIWARLVEAAAFDGFMPHPEDDLEWVYGLAEEDLDEDLVLALIEQFGGYVQCEKELEAENPLKTVRDMVIYISRMKGLGESTKKAM